MDEEMIIDRPSRVRANIQVRGMVASDFYRKNPVYIIYGIDTYAGQFQCAPVLSEEMGKSTAPGVSQFVENELILAKFFKELSLLVSDGKTGEAVRLLFDRVENWMIDQKIKLANDLFNDPRMVELNVDLQVGLLVITLPWASKLHSRKYFIEISRSTLLRSYSESDTNKILKGLIV